MGYIEEKERIIDYVTNNGKIIQLLPGNENLQANSREISRYNTYRSLVIRYPGYKTTERKCDYCVYLVDGLKEKAISHIEIMQDLYNKTTGDNYKQIKKYVEDVALVGNDVDRKDYINIDFNRGFSFDELTELMFYIAIQEDINYPGQGYQGRKMCFYRYIEAIYCKVHNKHSFQEAKNRANNVRYIPTLWNDVGSLYENIAKIKR